MNDNQTTAVIVMVIAAFLFFLYNSKTSNGESRLKAAVDAITGVAANNLDGAAAATNTAFDTNGPNAAAAYVNYADVNNTGMQFPNWLNTVAGYVGGKLIPTATPNDTNTTPDPANWYGALGGISYAQS